ncbi:zf-HC2 domain-containing protein [bacterium]|nr:MAG: zf-HC2 domain-containing protein [bacterium]
MHLDELAELYALGDLDERERRDVERHARVCSVCAQRLAESCQTVYALSALLPDAGEPPSLPVPVPAFVRPVWKALAALAVAAAVLLAVISGVLLQRLDAQRGEIAALRAPQIALAQGHFAHLPLRAAAAGAPRGKVIYALDRSWYYVLIDGPGPYQLWIHRDGAWRDAGMVRGNPAYALVRGAVEEVAVSAPGAPQSSALLRVRLPVTAPARVR